MNLFDGQSCWTCDCSMVDAVPKRPKHNGVILREQYGPRYCVRCIRNGRKVIVRKNAKQPKSRPVQSVAEFHERQRLTPMVRQIKNRMNRQFRDKRIKERRLAKETAAYTEGVISS